MSVNSLMEKKRAKSKNAKEKFAKRAKKARAKETRNKTILLLVVLALVGFAVAALTPVLPDQIYARIQRDKLDPPTAVAEGKIKSLFQLAVFYGWTFREPEAMQMYDEISLLVNGFTITEFTQDRDKALAKRQKALNDVKRQRIQGPPYTISDSDVLYYGKAIYEAGQLVKKLRSDQVMINLYRHLYMADFMARDAGARTNAKAKPFPNPDLTTRDDPELTQIIDNRVARWEGRK